MANEFGSDVLEFKVAVLEKPDPPMGPVQVSEQTPESCRLVWTAPTYTGGADGTDYVVERCDDGSDKWEKAFASVVGTACCVKRLEAGKRYRFRVRAQNPYGLSDPLVTEPVLAQYPFGISFYVLIL